MTTFTAVRRRVQARADSGGSFLVAGAALSVALLGSNLATPLYPLYRDRFGFSPFVLTLVFGVYMLVVVPGFALLGPLSDTLGRRAVLALGLLASGAGSAILAGAQSTTWLFVGRAVLGLGLPTVMSTAVVTLVKLEPRGDVHRASVAATTALLGGSALGPLLAGALAAHLPHPLIFPYVLHLGLVLAALAGVAFMSEPLAPPSRRRWTPRRPRIGSAPLRPFVAAAGAGAVASAVGGLFVALVPSFAATLLGTHDPLVQGAIVALFLFTAMVVQLGWPSRPGPGVTALGVALLLAGLGGCILAGHLGSLPMLIAAAVLSGAGEGLGLMGALAMVAGMAGIGEAAQVTSAYYAAIYLATFVVVGAVGALATQVDLLTAVTVMAVTVGAVSAAALPVLLAAGPRVNMMDTP